MTHGWFPCVAKPDKPEPWKRWEKIYAGDAFKQFDGAKWREFFTPHGWPQCGEMAKRLPLPGMNKLMFRNCVELCSAVLGCKASSSAGSAAAASPAATAPAASAAAEGEEGEEEGKGN